MKLKQVRLELLNELRRQGKIAEKELSQTWETWSGDKPKAISEIALDGKEAGVLTGVDGSEKAINKFKWLDEGTSKRWALMSPGWKSKTSPGRLKSGRGRGKVILAGRRAMQQRGHRQPRPGIKARNWTEQIEKRRRRPFTAAIIKAKNKGLKNLYG